MTINRLFNGLGWLVALAVGLLAIPVAISTLKVSPGALAIFSPGAGQANVAAIEQARLEFRRGEWYAGSETVNALLDLHDRQTSAAAYELQDPEVQRFIGYADQVSAALAAQTFLDQRRGEWYAGSGTVYAPLDLHDRQTSAAAALAAQAHLDQRRGEWNAGHAAGQAEFDVEQARLDWRPAK